MNISTWDTGSGLNPFQQLMTDTQRKIKQTFDAEDAALDIIQEAEELSIEKKKLLNRCLAMFGAQTLKLLLDERKARERKFEERQAKQRK